MHPSLLRRRRRGSTVFVTPTSVTIQPSSPVVVVGRTTQLSAVNQVGQTITSLLSWSSSDATKATINSSTGVVTGVAAGSVTFTASWNSGAVTGTKAVTVAAQVLTSAVMTTAPTTVVTTHTVTFAATGYDQLGYAMTVQPTFSFASSVTATATINSSTGVATGVATGTTSITATSGAVTTPGVTLTDDAQTLASITISPSSPTVANGTGQTFTKAGTDTLGGSMTVGAGTWASSDATDFPITSGGVCTPNVDSGSSVIQFTETASGVSGTTTITATAASGGTVTPIGPFLDEPVLIDARAGGANDIQSQSTISAALAQVSVENHGGIGVVPDKSTVAAWNLETNLDGAGLHALREDEIGWHYCDLAASLTPGTPKTTTSAIAAGSSSSFTVNDATGLAVGDFITVGTVGGTYDTVQIGSISGLTIVSAAGAAGYFNNSYASSGINVFPTQTFAVTDTTGFFSGAEIVIDYDNGSAEKTFIKVVDATHVTAPIGRAHSSGAKCGLSNDWGLYVTLTTGPSSTRAVAQYWKGWFGKTASSGGMGTVGSFQFTNSAPYSGGGSNNAAKKFGLLSKATVNNREDCIIFGPAGNIGLDSDALNHRDDSSPSFVPGNFTAQVIEFVRLTKMESASGAADGVWELWVRTAGFNGGVWTQVVNDTAIANTNHALVGDYTGWQFPSTFRSPSQDQSAFYWDFIQWIPLFASQVVPDAPSAATNAAGSTSITNNVTLAATGGAVTAIRPFHRVNGTSTWTQDTDVDLTTIKMDRRGTTVAVTTSGLTAGNYDFQYEAVNSHGAGSASSALLNVATQAFTPWTAGLDFRSGSGSATDPTGFAVDTNIGYPHTYTMVGGGTFQGGTTGSGLDVRDRSGTARLFGFIAEYNSGQTGIIKIDLPTSGGTYSIDMGGGDNTATQGNGTQQVEVWDLTNNVKLFTINAVLSAAGYFYDAMNNVYSSQSAWTSGHTARTGVVIPGDQIGIKLVSPPSILSTFQITRTA